MRNIIILFLLLFSVGLSAQITVNTNFQVNSALPIDTRMVLDSLSDTTNVTFAFDGLQAFVKDTAQFWYYNSKWQVVETGGGVDTFYLENGVYKIVVGSDTLTANLSVNFGNVLYVASYGNDLTAVKGDPNRPWSRLDSAYINSIDGDVMVVLDSVYQSSKINITGEGAVDFNLILSDAGVIDFNGHNIIEIDTVSDFNFKITGNGKIISRSNLFSLQEATSGTLIIDVPLFEGFLGTFAGEWDVNINVGLGKPYASGTTSMTMNFGYIYFDGVVLTVRPKNSYINVNIGTIISPGGYIIGGYGLDSSYFKMSIGNLICLDASYGNLWFMNSGSFTRDSQVQYDIGNARIIITDESPYTTTNEFFNLRHQFLRTDFVVNIDNAYFDQLSLSSDWRNGTSGASQDFSVKFTGNWIFKNDYILQRFQTFSGTCTNCEYTLNGNFTADSTLFLMNYAFGRSLNLSGRFETKSSNSPIIFLDNSNPINIEGAVLETNSTQAAIQGASGTVNLTGDVSVFSDSIDTDITYNLKRNLGSNSIYDRLLFGNYTIDQNTSSLRLDTLNQFVVVTENSQSLYSLAGNIEIRADSGNVVLNGGPTGELKMQGYSLTSAITGAGVSNDGMTGVFVQNDAGDTRLTSRLLPQFDTVNVSTANDTIDIDFAFDQTVVVNMNSAPATVDFVVQNPVKGSTLTLVFTSVGSSHTFNFGHTDIQLATKTGWTIDSSSAKVYVLRYNIDGGGDWIIVRDE